MSIGRIAGGIGRLTVPPAPVVQQSSGGGGGGGEFPSFSAAVPLFLGLSYQQVFSDNGVTPATGTDPVQQWKDSLGGAYVATITGGSRPVLEQNVLNGKQFLNTAGDKYLRIIPASNWTGTRLSVYIVIVRGVTLADNSRLLSCETSNLDHNDPGAGILIAANSTPRAFGYRADNSLAVSGTTLSSGQPYLIVSRFNTVAKTHRIKTRGEGSYNSVTIPDTPSAVMPFDVNSFLIGCGWEAGPTAYSLAKFGAVVLVDETTGLITDDEDAAIQSYLAHANRFGSGLL